MENNKEKKEGTSLQEARLKHSGEVLKVGQKLNINNLSKEAQKRINKIIDTTVTEVTIDAITLTSSGAPKFLLKNRDGKTAELHARMLDTQKKTPERAPSFEINHKFKNGIYVFGTNDRSQITLAIPQGLQKKYNLKPLVKINGDIIKKYVHNNTFDLEQYTRDSAPSPKTPAQKKKALDTVKKDIITKTENEEIKHPLAEKLAQGKEIWVERTLPSGSTEPGWKLQSIDGDMAIIKSYEPKEMEMSVPLHALSEGKKPLSINNQPSMKNNIENNTSSKTHEGNTEQTISPIASKRSEIKGYEDEIRSYEKGENFKASPDAIDKLHDKINKAENELRDLENEKRTAMEKIERLKKIAEKRSEIKGYEDQIRSYEKGENFKSSPTVIDELHEKINKAENELRDLEQGGSGVLETTKDSTENKNTETPLPEESVSPENKDENPDKEKESSSTEDWEARGVQLKKERDTLMATYAQAYKNHYKEKGALTRFVKDALSRTGFFNKEDSDAKLTQAPENSTGSTLLQAKRAYYEAQQKYLDNRFRQINLVVGKRLERMEASLDQYKEQIDAAEEQLRQDPDNTELKDQVIALRDNYSKAREQYDTFDLQEYTETLHNKYRAISAVSAGEKVLNDAKAEAFDSTAKRIAKKFGDKWNSLPWYAKMGISSALIGAGVGVGTVLSGGTVGVSAIAAVIAKRKVGGLIGGFIGGGAMKLAEKVIKKNPAELRAQLEQNYNTGVITYEEYQQGIAEVEKTDRKWKTGVTAGTVGGALAGAMNTDNLYNSAFGDDTDALRDGARDIRGETPPRDMPMRGIDEPLENTTPVGEIERPPIEAVEPITVPEWDNVPDYAKVQQGDGVTNIFNRQLQANPELLAAAEEHLGMDYESNRAGFLMKLAQEAGYINESGTADVRLSMNPNNTYELIVKDGQLFVNEWENGTLDSTHAMGEGFQPEQNTLQGSHEYQYNYTNQSAESGSISNTPPEGGAIGTQSESGSIGDRPSPEDIFNQDMEQTETPATGSVEEKMMQTSDEYFNEKNRGWKLEDGKMIWYERDVAPLPAKEVFTHIAGYEAGEFSIKDQKFEALVPFMSDIFQKIEARGIDWQSWPEGVSLDQAAYIAEGGDIDGITNSESMIPEAPAPEATPTPVSGFENYSYDQVTAIVEGTNQMNADQALGSLSYFKNIFGDRFNFLMNVPYGQLEGVMMEGQFASAPQGLLRQAIEKIATSGGFTPEAGMSIKDVVNQSLYAMGSTQNADSLVV